MSLLLDIVPNHMGVGGADNPWWLSVLEWGELSPFADTFDIDWERLGAHGKLVAPNLGAQYGEVLEKGDLKLSFDREAGKLQRRLLRTSLSDLPAELSRQSSTARSRSMPPRGRRAWTVCSVSAKSCGSLRPRNPPIAAATSSPSASA